MEELTLRPPVAPAASLRSAFDMTNHPTTSLGGATSASTALWATFTQRRESAFLEVTEKSMFFCVQEREKNVTEGGYEALCRQFMYTYITRSC
jgi:hypothetical protein